MPEPPREEPAKRRRGGPNRSRTVLAVVIIVLVALALSLRAIATFWTDFLWFDSLELTTVWRRLLSAKVTLGVGTALAFFVLLWTNMVLADRLAPKFRSSRGPDDEILMRYRELVAGRQRLVWLVVALLIAVVPGISAAAQWREWLLFRYGGSFGVEDDLFSTDVSFYVFKLPFLSSVVDWVFGFLVVTVVVVAIVHYLNGAIRVQPLGERVTPNAKAHLSVLFALAAFVKAGDYYLQRFELTVSSSGSFNGAGYTDVNARLPAIQLMILISVFAGVLILVNIRRKGWALPATIVALWVLLAVVAGAVYPAFVQRFQVDPAELAKEKPFIERNIDATRAALGLSDVGQIDFDYDPTLTQAAIDEDPTNLDNARLLDPAFVLPTIQDMQFEREYYAFLDVDVDRYSLDDKSTPVVVSARELNLEGVSNPSWEKLHLVFTHGYAAALAPANSVNNRGEPQFLVEGIPAQVSELPPLEKPEIYVGEDMDGYSIVGTKQTELSTDNVKGAYDGTSGVTMGSLARKAAFALRFGEIEPLISDSITDESKVIYNRDVVGRVREVAPFLEFDPDPYPVLLDGRVQYIVDAYTTSNNYPYAQTLDASAIDGQSAGAFNYLRNSVKAVVDSYDGTVTLYLTDELYGAEDPIIRAYMLAFPDLFTSEIPDEVQDHFRYPEFMFKAQTVAWGRYHQTDPSTFFNNSDRWAVAPKPPDRGSTTAAEEAAAAAAGEQGVMPPYYQELKIGSAENSEFVLTRPFVLTAGDGTGRNLTSVMIARNDRGNYGELEEIVMTTSKDGETERNNDVDGPERANRKMVTYEPVAEYQTLVGTRGSRVRFGNVLILPQDQALIYMRPIYAAEEGSDRFTLKKVVVASGDAVGFGDDVESAISDMLDGDPDQAVDAPSDPIDDDEEASTSTTTTTTPDAQGESATDLLAQADAKFSAADEALSAADLEGYARLVAEGRALVARASAALDG